jgi:hypothetical protein
MSLATAAALVSASTATPGAMRAPMPIAEPVPTRAHPRPRQRPARVRRPKVGPVGLSHHASRHVPPARLTRRGAVLCWMLAALATVDMVFGLFHGLQSSTPSVVGTQAVTVHPGESLWALAQHVNPGVDPRVTIAAIRDANGLGSVSIVQPGTTLAVPVYESAR